MARFSGLLSTLIGLAVVALAIWFLRRPDGPPPAEAARPPFMLPVTLVEVRQDTLRPSVGLTGTVRSPARARYGFEVAGRLASLNVREVDRFEVGDELARLDDTDGRLAVAEAAAELALARTELAKLEAGTREQEVDRLAAEHSELVALAALAQSDVERFRPLVRVEKIKSEAELERLEALRDAADARVAGKAAELAQARAGTRTEDIAIAQAKLTRAKARLDVAKAGLAKTVLVARTDGVVLARLATEGDHLTPGTPVLEVLDPRELEIAVEVPGRYVASLSDAPAARVTADDLPGWSMAATLDVTIPAADEKSRNFLALVRLDGIDDEVRALQPGMFVRLDLDLRALPDALIVPADAIRQSPRGPELVRAITGPPGPDGLVSTTAQVLSVKVLAVEDGEAAISAPGADPPLADKDKIVVTGVDSAFPGASLLPADQGAPQ